MELDEDGYLRAKERHYDLAKRPKTRVELHIHLEGAVRHLTILELIKRKGTGHFHEEQHEKTSLHEINSLEELKKRLTIRKPTNLRDFLHLFHIFMPLIV